MKPLALFIAIAALACGLVFEDNHYRLRDIGHPSDQVVLDHKDSSYTSMTWVGSASENYLQLRFFDKVEGGVCLHPTWAELNELALKDRRLAHLRYVTVPGGGRPAAATWPGELPDPGTLPNSAYVRFFPAGVLLNQGLMAKANQDPRAADPHILVIGMGSSAGILVLAHHFPQASITVVDIDHEVLDIVRAHVPLARWLESQKTADGSPRLKLIAQDARQFVRFDARTLPRPYDLIILDAYTAGSTIPSHLMTREFFAQCAAALSPDGLVIGNIIGSYTGDKRKVVGGCLRSLRAGGLEEAYNLPVISHWSDTPGSIDLSQARNNIVMASRKPLDPKRNATGWQRLQEFVPFPELPTDTYRSTQYSLLDERGRPVSSLLHGAAVDLAEPSLRLQLKVENQNPGAPQYAQISRTDDQTIVASARRAAATWYQTNRGPLKLTGSPLGWDDAPEAKQLWRRDIDWVRAAREVWRVSILGARDAGTHGGEALVGPVDGPGRDDDQATWRISDAPLFTDQMPNADIAAH